MSRKVLLTLAAAATFSAAATLASSAADARGFGGGGGFGGGHFASFGHGGGGGFGGARFTGMRFTGNHFNHFNHFPGRTFAGLRRPPIPPFPPIWWWHHHHHHWHWWFHDGRWDYGEEPVVDPVVAPVGPVATPGPCTCLTKTYTQDGLVVFADLCTKEAASAPVGGGEATPPAKSSELTPPAPPVAQADGKAAADASQAPTSNNYAGKTYQDFLAANGLAQKN